MVLYDRAMIEQVIQTSKTLAEVKYEICGQLAHRAGELEKQGYEILSLNIGNPGLFGFRTPETMRLAMIENLGRAEPYSHQKGIFPAREAVVMQQQDRGVVRHYPCPPEKSLVPDLAALEAMVTPRTRALVIINPNNPTGAVYDRVTLEQMVALAEQHNLVVLSDEIYDQMVFDDAEIIPIATLVRNTVSLTYSGLSKVYRACGHRVGWCVFTGEQEKAEPLKHAMELLAALRLCSNVPGQWAVQTALGGFQSIGEQVSPGGRLFQSRQAVADAIGQSRYLDMIMPRGAMYAFIRLDEALAGKLDDRAFALELLESKHVLVAPGSSFNTPYSDHFRITTLPDPDVIKDLFSRIDTLLAQHA